MAGIWKQKAKERFRQYLRKERASTGLEISSPGERLKKYLPLLSILLLYQISFGQSVDWQRQFLVGTKILSSHGIVYFNESTIFSAIAAREWGYAIQNSSGTAYGIGLVKLQANTGDTIFVRRVGGWTSFTPDMKIHKSFEGNLVIASKSVGDTILDSKILIQKVDTNGNSIWKLPLSAGLNDPQVSKVLPTSDGGTFVMGSDFSTIGGLQDWLLIKVSYNGQLQWTQRFNGGNDWYCKGNNIEPMRNGHYLLSGMAERMIWSVEIDENGNQLGQDTVWFGTAPNLVFDTVVRQTRYQSLVASGTYGSNPARISLENLMPAATKSGEEKTLQNPVPFWPPCRMAIFSPLNAAPQTQTAILLSSTVRTASCFGKSLCQRVETWLKFLLRSMTWLLMVWEMWFWPVKPAAREVQEMKCSL